VLAVGVGGRVTQRPAEGRETLGFLAGILSGPVLLAMVLGIASGFSTNSLKIAAGALLFAVGPGTLLLGLPMYYAIRKVRVPELGWTVAFAAAISAAPVLLAAALGVGRRPGAPPGFDLIVATVIVLGAAACGALGGLVFWLLVFKDVAKGSGDASGDERSP
jgi:hypothetical protein